MPRDAAGGVVMQNVTKSARMPAIMRTSAAIGLALLAAACSTPQEKSARAQSEMAELMNIYGPACSQLGYSANTDPWRECVLHLGTREELQRVGNGAGAYGAWGPRYRGGYWGPYW